MIRKVKLYTFVVTVLMITLSYSNVIAETTYDWYVVDGTYGYSFRILEESYVNDDSIIINPYKVLSVYNQPEVVYVTKEKVLSEKGNEFSYGSFVKVSGNENNPLIDMNLYKSAISNKVNKGLLKPQKAKSPEIMTPVIFPYELIDSSGNYNANSVDLMIGYHKKSASMTVELKHTYNVEKTAKVISSTIEQTGPSCYKCDNNIPHPAHADAELTYNLVVEGFDMVVKLDRWQYKQKVIDGYYHYTGKDTTVWSMPVNVVHYNPVLTFEF